MFKVTPRLLRLIRLSEQMIGRRPDRPLLTPTDLFIGGLYERSGVLGELYLHGRFRLLEMQEVAEYAASSKKSIVGSNPFKTGIAQDTLAAFTKADEIRESYRQVFINEGHLYDALLAYNEVEALLQYSESKITKREIRDIVCSPRDMAARLNGFTAKDSVFVDVVIRRADRNDYPALHNFVQRQFGDRWLTTIECAFKQSEIPVFVALVDQIVGFACYDVVGMKKGIFGPMGTSRRCRTQGIGKSLLLRCLSEMQCLGYDYVIIKQAGPIEFYEKACGAVLIPRRHTTIPNI